MTPESKRSWFYFVVAMGWLYLLIWPLVDLNSDGTIGFAHSFSIWLPLAEIALGCMVVYQLYKTGRLDWLIRAWRRTTTVENPPAPDAGGLEKTLFSIARARHGAQTGLARLPKAVWYLAVLACAFAFPFFNPARYTFDVVNNVLVYVCLGLGLNVVVGLCGLLDLGYIAFYGVGAYTYALLSIHFAVPFWVCLPIAALLAAIAGCIIGWPTLRMRGDYLAIVTLGFGEIVRLVLNNWMDLTNGPNGILNISPATVWWPSLEGGFHFETLSLRTPSNLYWVVLFLAVITVIGVHRLNFSRIGRAWEAVREDETAAELMGVNTFLIKLLAYAMGATFAGLAGTFFAARMRFVSPESFTFLESALVLAIVVLGGMGSIPGIILGAVAIIALPEIFRDFELYRMLAFGGAMTLMMLVRPTGLIPAKRMGQRGEDSA